MGRQAVLFDAVALGLPRKELVSSLGAFAARGILTRFGYAHGWRAGEAIQQEHPELWVEGKAGPRLPALQGQFLLSQNLRTDGPGEAPLVDTERVAARVVHAESSRADRAFVSLNCGAIPESLLERELFGHVKGSSTGAEADAPGLFEAASGRRLARGAALGAARSAATRGHPAARPGGAGAHRGGAAGHRRRRGRSRRRSRHRSRHLYRKL